MWFCNYTWNTAVYIYPDDAWGYSELSMGFPKSDNLPRPLPRWLRQPFIIWVWLLLLYFAGIAREIGMTRSEAIRALDRASGREPETMQTDEEEKEKQP